MTPEVLAVIMFLTTLLFLLFGFPVAFTLAGSSLIFAFVGDLLGVFNFKMLLFFPQRIYGVMINEALVAVPLFIFMGVMLEKTRIAAKLLDSIGDYDIFVFIFGLIIFGFSAYYLWLTRHYMDRFEEIISTSSKREFQKNWTEIEQIARYQLPKEYRKRVAEARKKFGLR